jgi:transcriptional regulator with XRE-family HTH domain
MKLLGARVRRERARLGWDQAELAQRMGVGQQTVSGWERGASRPRRAMVGQLADLFGIDVDVLLREAGYVAATADTPAEEVRPVRPLLTLLPLQALPPEQFESFSADLARLLHPGAAVHRVGGQGHKQHGVDVVVNHPRGRPTGIQCKRERTFGPKKVRDAVAALTTPVRQCYIFLARIASPPARAEIKKHPRWELWDADDISRAVRQLPPEAALRLVDTYFVGWREAFLGIAEPSPWLTRTEFFQPYRGIVSYDGQLIGRGDELAGLLSLLESGGELGVLFGRGGLGKTRLLRAFADRAELDRRAVVRFLAPQTPPRPADFELLPTGEHLVVIVDDAHDRSDLAAVLLGIRRARPHSKVLLAMRPYGNAQLAADLRQIGLHPSEIASWRLEDLKTQEAAELAQAALPPETASAVVERLAGVGVDCPLLIVVAGHLIGQGQLDPTTLEGSGHLRDEILAGFRNAMAGDQASGDQELRREVLDAVAILQPFRTDDDEFHAAMAGLTGQPYDRVAHHLRSLEDGGILLRRGQSVRVVPDLLGDVILAQAMADTASGRPTGYLERVWRTVSGQPLLHVFVNGARVDWQVRQGTPNATSLVEPLWRWFEQQFRETGPNARLALLAMLRKVAYFQPQRALTLARWAYENPTEGAAADGNSESLLHYHPTNDDVVRGLPQVIEHVAYNAGFLPEALDLLWQLSRTDERPTNQYPEHPIRVLCALAEYQIGKPRLYNEAVVDAAARWLAQPEVGDLPHSPFDVLEVLLASELEERIPRDHKLLLRSRPLNVDAVAVVRGRVIDLALSEVRSPDPRRAVNAINAITRGLHFPRGLFGREVSDTERSQWTPIICEEIQRLGELGANESLDPVVNVAIRKVLHPHAQSSGVTKDPAAQALERFPASFEHDFALALHDGWGRILGRKRGSHDDASDRQAFFDRVASTATNLWADEELCSRLEQRLTIDRRAFNADGGGAGNPGPFVWTLIRTRPSFGSVICRRVIDDPASVLLGLVPDALNRLANSNFADTVVLAEALIATSSAAVARHVAHAFAWGRGDRSHLLDKEADLLRSLATHDDPTIRRIAAQAVQSLSSGQRPLALDLATAIRFTDDAQTAAELLGAFGSHGRLRWDELSAAQAAALLDQLRRCPSIDDYHLLDFLSHLSRTEPDTVVRMLLDRAEIGDELPYSEYRPLPHHWEPPLHVKTSDRFPEILRSIRDWIFNGEASSRRSDGPEIFRAVAQDYDAQAIHVLDETLLADTPQHIRVVGAILREAPRNLVWDNVPFVTRALHIAERHGHDSIRAIGSGLHTALTSGSRSGSIGEPYQEDIEQRDKSAEIANQLPTGSIEQRFYRSLTRAAEASIRWEIEHDRPTDRRDW